jgi:hypothetical protein
MEQPLNNHDVETDKGSIIMNTHYQHEHNQFMADKSSIATYLGGGFSAFWGIVTSQEFGILIGMLVGIAGLCMNYYYKQRDDKYKLADERRKQELHDVTLRAMANNED